MGIADSEAKPLTVEDVIMGLIESSTQGSKQNEDVSISAPR